MNRELYAENLRLLCSYYGPISKVCRSIGINRQQFNKYLSGVNLPAEHNNRKICDFFGVESHELLLPSTQFAEIIKLRPIARKEQDAFLERVSRVVKEQTSSVVLSKYQGFYYKYFNSFSHPGYILQSLVCVYEHQNRTLYKTIERIKKSGQKNPFIFKYNGILFKLGDRIYMADMETVLGNEISCTILYPSYLNRVSYLSGLILGVAGNEAHQPVSARVVMEYLGRSLDIRAALRRCGLHDTDDGGLDPAVRRGVDNRVPAANALLYGIPH